MAQSELRNALRPEHTLHWYRIERILGQGGFGITYLAYDANLAQPVAIKEYLPMELAVREGDFSVYPASAAHGDRYRWGLDRFIAEARTLARFKHPAIVRVLSVFEENNTAYMVMEYERGHSLQEVLDRRRTLPEQEIEAILRALLYGLEMIHQHGFIHRDIKPANIYVREDGSPVLLDFGSARQSLGEQTRSLTSIVSPGYAPFEQYYTRSNRQGPWTDIYSLAATCYRAVAGVMPMDAIDRSEAILKTKRDIFVTLREIGAGKYSERFLAALDHGLHFDEKKRPQSVTEWRDEFGYQLPSAPPPSASLDEVPFSHLETITSVAGGWGEDEDEDGAAAPGEAAAPPPSVRLPRDFAAEAGSDSVPIDLVLEPDAAAPTQLAPESVGLPPKRRGHWFLLATGLGLAAAAAVVVLNDALVESIGATYRQLTESSVDGAARVEALVAEGDAALAAGQVFDPPQSNALHFYREAIRLAPDHAGAGRGLERIAGRIVPEFEAALGARAWSDAERLIALGRSLPEGLLPVGEWRERMALERGRADAAAATARRIERFLDEADAALAEGNLTGAGNDNALAKFRAVQILAPDNHRAARGVRTVGTRLAGMVEEALELGDFDAAESLLPQVAALNPAGLDLAALRESIVSARDEAAAASAAEDRVEELLAAAQADVTAQRLTAPAGNNAFERYQAVLELDPDNAAARAGIAMVADRYAALVDQALAEDDVDRAATLLERARGVASGDARWVVLQDRLDQRRERLAAESERAARKAAEVAAEARRREAAAQAEQAKAERRQRQEAEALRLLAEAEEAAAAARAAAVSADTLVVSFDGFNAELARQGLDPTAVLADLRPVLQGRGYRVRTYQDGAVPPGARLLVVKVRANLNTTAGSYSYAVSLALYERVPPRAGSQSALRATPLWQQGRTGFAETNELGKARQQYRDLVGRFVSEVPPPVGDRP